MKAIVRRAYGAADVLSLDDIDTPTPAGDEVLIRVRAAAVNPLDWHFMRGTPYLMRMQSGLRTPTNVRLGADVAGVVVSGGTEVADIKAGDEVFGTARGSFAEYACARAGAVARRPRNLPWEAAGAVPVAGVTALQALRDRGQVAAGTRVLVNGAAGGVGTFAVQIAKAFGAHVTAVCSSRNVDLVRSLGADAVVDYTTRDFCALGERFHVMIDNVGNRSLADCRRVLTATGTYVMVGGPAGRWVAPFPRVLRMSMLSPFVGQRMGLLFTRMSGHADLDAMRELTESGKVTPVVDRCYKLSEVADAVRYVEGGHARGKVVIRVAER